MMILTASILVSGSVHGRGICESGGYHSGPRVNVHVGYGHRSGNADELLLLLLFSSTSTTIYCISEENERRKRHSKNLEEYTTTNYAKLMEEGAKGEGEHLFALTQLFGCNSTVKDRFFELVQSQFEQLFSDETENEKNTFAEKMATTINNDQILSTNCEALP